MRKIPRRGCRTDSFASPFAESSMRRSLLACAVVLVSIISVSAAAQKSSALINEAMDKLYALDVKQNTPLQQILKQITNETSVPIQVSGETWDLLPYGEGTALT